MAITKNSNTYAVLKSEIKKIIEKGREQVATAASKIMVETYWRVGRRLDGQVEKKQTATAAELMTRLAADLEIDQSVLYRSLKFFRSYPDGLPDTSEFNRLSWSAHMEMLPVTDPDERLFYVERAAEEGWSRNGVRSAVRQQLFAREVRLKQGDEDASIKRPQPGLHTYEAVVERVVDGDTIIVRIDLGFDVWKTQRLRLRGLDTPPLDTPEGEKAMKFVQRKMNKAQQVVIRTYRHDKYGRFVADVFYGSAEEKKDALVKSGGFLNQDLLKQGLAVAMY